MELIVLYVNRWLETSILIFLIKIYSNFFLNFKKKAKTVHFPLYFPDSVSVVSKRIDDANENNAPCLDCLCMLQRICGTRYSPESLTHLENLGKPLNEYLVNLMFKDLLT